MCTWTSALTHTLPTPARLAHIPACLACVPARLARIPARLAHTPACPAPTCASARFAYAPNLSSCVSLLVRPHTLACVPPLAYTEITSVLGIPPQPRHHRFGLPLLTVCATYEQPSPSRPTKLAPCTVGMHPLSWIRSPLLSPQYFPHRLPPPSGSSLGQLIGRFE